jgi:hypothetical protein
MLRIADIKEISSNYQISGSNEYELAKKKWFVLIGLIGMERGEDLLGLAPGELS